MANTALEKNCSVLLSLTISGLDNLILYLGEVLYLLAIQSFLNRVYAPKKVKFDVPKKGYILVVLSCFGQLSMNLSGLHNCFQT